MPIGSLYCHKVSILVGCMPRGGVCPGEGVSEHGVSAREGVCSGGRSVFLGGCLPHTPHLLDRQTPVKILPCPKLRLRAVIKSNSICVGIEIGIGQCKHTVMTEQKKLVT